MTEREWDACTDLVKMITYLDPKRYDRRLRLFACTCCRRIWDLLPDQQSRRVVDLSEQYADGKANYEALRSAISVTVVPSRGWRPTWAALNAAAYGAASYTASANCYAQAAREAADARESASNIGVAGNTPLEIPGEGESSAQRELLREIIGPLPFRSIQLNPTWRAPQAVALARAMYDDRRFGEMPLLADALEEAGCAEEAVLQHCREPGEHVRGCWVVDLVLGKE